MQLNAETVHGGNVHFPRALVLREIWGSQAQRHSSSLCNAVVEQSVRLAIQPGDGILR